MSSYVEHDSPSDWELHSKSTGYDNRDAMLLGALISEKDNLTDLVLIRNLTKSVILVSAPLERVRCDREIW